MVALYGSSLPDRGRRRGSLGRHVQILLDRVPAHVQVALDLADRPVIGPVQAMQVVDLFGRKHGLDPRLYAQGVAGTRAMFLTRFRREGDNPLKDHDFGESYVVPYKIGRLRPNQPNLLPRNALSPELRCSLQAR